MSRFTKQITSYWQQFRTVVRNEYGSIFTDAGVILVLVLALLIYSTLYSLAYGTQVPPPITRKNCSADSRRSFRSMSMPAIF